MNRKGFDIWYDGQCIHEENDFDVEFTQDLYDDVIAWWNKNDNDGTEPEDYLVKIFVDGEEEELTIAEILE